VSTIEEERQDRVKAGGTGVSSGLCLHTTGALVSAHPCSSAVWGALPYVQGTTKPAPASAGTQGKTPALASAQHRQSQPQQPITPVTSMHAPPQPSLMHPTGAHGQEANYVVGHMTPHRLLAKQRQSTMGVMSQASPYVPPWRQSPAHQSTYQSTPNASMPSRSKQARPSSGLGSALTPARDQVSCPPDWCRVWVWLLLAACAHELRSGVLECFLVCTCFLVHSSVPPLLAPVLVPCPVRMHAWCGLTCSLCMGACQAVEVDEDVTFGHGRSKSLFGLSALDGASPGGSRALASPVSAAKRPQPAALAMLKQATGAAAFSSPRSTRQRTRMGGL